MEKLRVWFNQNKIFFEIVNLSVVAFAAIFIGWKSYQIQQTVTAREIIKDAPDLRANISSEHSGNILTVENIGGRIKNVTYFVASYLRAIKENKELVLRIQYIGKIDGPNYSTARILQSEKSNARPEERRIEKDFFDQKTFKPGKRSIEFIHAVQIMYEDLYGVPHTQCFVTNYYTNLLEATANCQTWHELFISTSKPDTVQLSDVNGTWLDFQIEKYGKDLAD